MVRADHHPYKNVAVPETDHQMLAKIAVAENRPMSRQISVMIREKFRALGLDDE